MISLFPAGILCSPVPCMVALCCRLCGKWVDCTCHNCFSEGICKCFCCEVESRKFRPLPPQPEEAIPTNPPAASADGDGRHRARSRDTGTGISDSASYSYANPDRVIFSVPGHSAGHGRRHAGAPPSTRHQSPRPYEVPQPRYGSTGTTARKSVQPPARNRQLSNTSTVVTTQPHSSAVPSSQHDEHPGHHPTGSPPPPHVITNFTSSPPAVPPKGIRPHSGSVPTFDPSSTFNTDAETNLLGGGNLVPLPPKPKSSTITGETSALAEAPASPPIHDTPPPLPPKSPADVLVMSRPGAAFNTEGSMQEKHDTASLALDVDDIHLLHQPDGV